MLVFKFGGASVKSSGGILNLAHIVESYSKENLAIVISAFGKTTNGLENILDLAWKNLSYDEALKSLKDYHLGIALELFQKSKDPIFVEITREFDCLNKILAKKNIKNYDKLYDQVISFGEILSTKIVSAFLNERGIKNLWVDIRQNLKTDDTFREAVVDWDTSNDFINKTFSFNNTGIYITQGFIGFSEPGVTTTLGREGSDFTASILAYILNASKVVIWKDVPGVLNADPKYFDNTVRIGQMSYLDAIELTYYGASVIHPKTIKPLQNKNINLHVKSFIYPNDPGTIIGDVICDFLVPSFIFKMDQVLMSISPKDFSFIAENNLKDIFTIISKNGAKINLMQNSAISFQVCINNKPERIASMINNLEKEFVVSYETGLELITIRYYDTQTINRVTLNKEILLEQKSKHNIQLVVKDLG